MTYRTMMRGATALVSMMMLCTAPQAAGLFRAYLASDGNDANPCTLTLPCRLLPAALTAVADGGEVWMLDSANYNTAQVVITKSVSILAIPGAVGSVLAILDSQSGTPIFVGILVDTPGVKVTLRNLVIMPQGGAAGGIYFWHGSELNVADCEIANMQGSAIYVQAPGSIVTV